MRYASRFIIGAIFGGVVGAALAILLAPTSGTDTRARITEFALNMKNEVENAARERRTELEQQLAHLRQQPPAVE